VKSARSRRHLAVQAPSYRRQAAGSALTTFMPCSLGPLSSLPGDWVLD
jgi:hypothetical protein